MNPKSIELEVSPEYVKRMQTEGAFDKMNNEPPASPECPYYMQGYTSIK